MTSDEVQAFIREAAPAEVSLWVALVTLFEAMDNVPQEMREAVVDIVYHKTEREDLAPWRAAVEHWE
jgi:hypothetical protein